MHARVTCRPTFVCGALQWHIPDFSVEVVLLCFNDDILETDTLESIVMVRQDDCKPRYRC